MRNSSIYSQNNKQNFNSINLVGEWTTEDTGGFTVCGMSKKTPYYLVDFYRRTILRVNKQEFKDRDGPVVVIQDCKIRILNGNKVQVLPILKTMKWEAEGLFSLVRSFVNFSTSTMSNFSTGIQILGSNPTVPPLLLDLFSIYVTAITPTYSNWTPSYLIGFLTRIASVVIRIKDLPFRSESLDAILMATLAMGMPKSISDILRNMSLLTSKKLLDTPNLIFDLMSILSNFLLQLFDLVPGIPQCVRDSVRSLLSLGSKYERMQKVKHCLDVWNKNKHVMMESEFRSSVKKLYGEVIEDDVVHEYVKGGPQVVRQRWEAFCRLQRSVNSYESCSRKEPVCIILEGPPGCRKTIASVKITEVLGLSTYVHIVKAVDDGKDFYDGYNNEEIFVMDDVGQQGPSQWRSVINMVSSLKLPLECANVDLKDTKYFDSEVMLLTTNQFTDIQFVRSDCISDKEALHRRGHVFRYEDSKCVYYRFDLNKHCFVSEHPVGMSVKLPLFCDLSAGPEASMEDLIPWMTAWIRVLKDHYSSIYNSIGCSPEVRKAFSDKADALIAMATPEYQDAWGAQSLWEDVSTASVDMCAEILNFVAYSVGSLTGKVAAFLGKLNDVAHNIPQWAGYLLISSVLAAGLGYLGHVWNKNDDEESNVGAWRAALAKHAKTPIKIVDGVVMVAEESVSTMLDAIKKHMGVIRFYRDDGSQPLTQCLLSGHHILVPAHSVVGVKTECSIYSSFDAVTNDWRIMDMVPFKIAYLDNDQDIAVLKLPSEMLTPFKKASQYFKSFGNKVAKPHMITCDRVVDLSMSVAIHPTSISYKQPNVNIIRTISNPMVYGISCPGLCGALIVDPDMGVVGMHLTGNGTTGASRIFSQSLLDKIRSVLEKDSNLCDVDSIKRDRVKFSGLPCRTTYVHTPQLKTHIIPSPLADVFPTTKYPANLASSGKTTVAVRAERYYKPQESLTTEEITFAKNVFNVLIPVFTPISEKDVIQGNDNLPPLNKKSVNGYFFPGKKEDYVDYEEGVMKPDFRREMEDFRNRVKNGTVRIEDVMMYEAIKDELRVSEKVDKPRTFTIDNLLAQFEMKRLMGSLFTQVISQKWYNQVMIGVNPYKDWGMIFDSMQKCELKWDADLGEWDAKQLAQMQDAFHNVVVSKFLGSDEDRNMLKFLLENSVRSWVLVQNTLFLGTHGMKSGKWITALFNSFYNRGYTAVWYHRMIRKNGLVPTVSEFISKIRDFVLGDDKLCGVEKNLASLKYPLDPTSMQEFFTSIGMTFTDGSKNSTVNAKETTELTFLKRGFKFHTQLGIVCPLSMETLTNSLMWADSTKDLDIVMDGKLSAFQREIFLHERQDLVEDLEKACLHRGVSFNRLPETYLLNLFKNEPDYAYKLYVRDKGLEEGVL